MKNIRLTLLTLFVVVAGLFAFTRIYEGNVKGTVNPADAAVRAWAISGTDTLRAPIVNGAFEFKNAKAGTYRLIIEAKPPFKNAAKDSIVVADGQPTDVGEIKLQQ